MFLIDTLGDFLMHTHNHHHPQQIQLSEFRESTNSLLGNENVEKKKKSGYATLGLVVHAAADGIAMGAASASDRSSLEFLVFMAIMLHKAPSAFGLSTFLLQQNRSRRNIRYYLLIFSLAAPIAAILTFLSLKQTLYTLFFPDDTQEPSSSTKKLDEEKQESIQVWTGVLLLFSAGTFLYVSTMHILPEIYVESGNGLSNSNEKKLSMGQILMLCLGMITPFFLSVGHHH
ncbi:hypothetical protein HK098_007740 [Nowakowskiella sp. JEL0407]|nr:hypothetical protein HK098_007740 [Nowakowskiella sp. JEL0407]